MELLKTITIFSDKHCYSPTITELSNQLNLSRSTIFEHLAELRKKGLLADSPLKARSLKPTSPALKLLRHLSKQSSNTLGTENSIPLLGKVAAGQPLEAIQDEQSLSLGECFGTTDDVFALEVTGDSMIEEDIRSGDYIICKRKQTANDGQLVVAIVDDENATLKRFHKEKSRVRLEPANKSYSPIYSSNCKIQAVAIGLVRKF
ncbi:MAG: transcriptional repressor LexA [Phycisphaerae bacterium]